MFTKKKHCSYCEQGITQHKAKFHRDLKSHCKQLAMNDKTAKDIFSGNLISSLVRLGKLERMTGERSFVLAKQIYHLLPKSYSMSCWTTTCVVSPVDQLLLRVIDWWNLDVRKGVCGTIHCYWNRYDNHQEEQMYTERLMLMDKRYSRSVSFVSGEYASLVRLVFKHKFRKY